MYGRLIKANEFDSESPEAVPAYNRIGYGLKSAYDFDKFSLGLTFFAAKDQEDSVDIPTPVEAGVNPQENLVISVDGKVKLFKNTILSAEFASSGLTADTRASGDPENGGPVDLLFNGNATTQYYKAFNAQVSTSIGNGSLGANYERVDPGYQTLGAYFFNNDLENISVNASQSIFNNNVNISVNAGLQRDNLDDTKTTELQRVVAAVNVSVKASEKLNINGSYSNFQSVTNIRDQFDFINAVSPFDNIDTLNFRQLSRNATLNIAYAISKSEKKVQNASINLSMQDTEDLQEQFLSGEQNTVGATTFFNTGGNYSLNFVPIDMSITAGVNASFNTTLDTDNTTIGPTLAISKLFLDKKLRSSFAASYNQSSVNGELQNTILNFRVNAGYQLLEKHQLNLSALSLFRNNNVAGGNNLSNDFTVTFGYNYSFTTGKKTTPRERKQTPGIPASNLTTIQFRANGQIYEGTSPEVYEQINTLNNASRIDNAPAAAMEKINLAKLHLLDLKNGDNKELKNAAIDYLTAIEEYNAFAKAYEDGLLFAIKQLTRDARAIDSNIARDYAFADDKITSHKYKGVPPTEVQDKNAEDYTEYVSLYKNYELQSKKFIHHRYMLDRIKAIRTIRDINKEPQLQQFKKAQITKVYDAYGDIKKTPSSISELLTGDLIIYYQNLAAKFADNDIIRK